MFTFVCSYIRLSVSFQESPPRGLLYMLQSNQAAGLISKLMFPFLETARPSQIFLGARE